MVQTNVQNSSEKTTSELPIYGSASRTTSEFMIKLRSMICTLLIHPVEPQLAEFIGPTTVHQAWECEEQSVGRSG